MKLGNKINLVCTIYEWNISGDLDGITLKNQKLKASVKTGFEVECFK